MNQVIPEAAVEAAAKADYGDGWDRASEWERSAYLDHSKLLLEAAAPHLIQAAKAEAWEAGVDEAESCGWMHDAGAADTKARNPYR